MAKYRQATGETLRRAWNKCAKVMAEEEGTIVATEQDAGFVMPKGWPKGEGYQVCVKMYRFSQASLDNDVYSGGLLVNVKANKRRKK
jgi:hypothetical protein